MPNEFIQKLISAGEENLPALIKRLRGAAPAVEENAGNLVRRAETMAPEVLEEAPLQKGLRHVENEYVQPALTGAGEVTDDVISKVAPIAEQTGMNLGRKAAIGAGIAGAGALAYMNDGEPPKDTSSMVGAGDNSDDTELDNDPNDTIQNPIKKPEETKSALDYLALSKPEATPQIPMAPVASQPKAPDQFENQLNEARGKDASNNLLFGLLKAAQTGGSALAGSKADTSYADSQLARPNEITNELKVNQDLLEERKNIIDKNEKRDPNSKTSLLYQNTLKQLNPGMDVTGLSAEQVEKAFPTVAAAINRQDTIQANKEKYHQQSLDRQALMENKKAAAIEKTDEKDKAALVKAQKEMDEQRASARSPLGREVMRLNGAQHAKNIIDKYRGNENAMPDVLKKELAVAMATMVSPGLPHESTINAMDLKTFQGNVGDVISKVTGIPMAAGAGGFVKLADSMITNQAGIAKKIIQDQQKKQLAVYKNSFHNPETYKTLENLYKSNDDLGELPLDKTQAPLTTNVNSTAQDPKIAQYATAHNLDYATASNILKARGYNGGK